MIFSIASVWHWSVQYTLPSVKEFGTMIGLTLILFPFILIKEFHFRNVQGQLKTTNRYKEYFSMVGIGFFMENFLIILIMLIIWLHIYSGPISALFLSVWVLFSLIQEFATTWMYMNSGRNILGSTIFRCIFFTWIAVSFFPYGFI